MGESAEPATTPIATGWRHRADPRRGLRRVAGSSIAILQIVVAATGAYAFSAYALGHTTPLLAATVCVASLGLVRDARPRRVLETVVGMLVGILVAELLLLTAGSGWWQLALALGATLAVARFLSPQASFALAAGIQAVIVIVIPSASPFQRLIDGVIGGVAALLVTALIPRTLQRDELRAAATVFRTTRAAADTIARALERGSLARAERGLEKARGLQEHVDAWAGALESSIAIARISPIMRRHRTELLRHDRVRRSVDLATRNLRVIARRAVYLCEDGAARPVDAGIFRELARTLDLIEASLTDISVEPVAREAIRAVAARLEPSALLPDGSPGDFAFVAALRPFAVDLLTATGMTSAEARACVPRL